MANELFTGECSDCGAASGEPCAPWCHTHTDTEPSACAGCGFRAGWHGVTLVDGLCADCILRRREAR